MTTVESIEFKVDGLTLRGKIFQAAKPKNLAVLFLHGWTGSPNEPAAQKISDNGYTSMIFSLSGHNDSEGKLEDVTRKGSLDEGTAAYDFFKSKLPLGTKITAVGSSYGSYMSALLSNRREISSMSLRVPANYPDEHFEEPQLPQAPDWGNTDLIEWRRQMASYEVTKSLTAVHDFKGHIQIIEAEEDDLVPHETIQNYVNAISDKSKLDYHFMKGWPHSLGDDPKRNQNYQEVLLNWLNKINVHLTQQRQK